MLKKILLNLTKVEKEEKDEYKVTSQDVFYASIVVILFIVASILESVL